MNAQILAAFRRELLNRGFAQEEGNLRAPRGTMCFGEKFLAAVQLAELFEQMVERREKVSRSYAVVGKEAAESSYHDVSLVVDALREVLHGLELPDE